jgi:hypothetical protein
MQFVEMPPSSSVKYPRSLPISLVSFPGTPIRTRTFFRAHPTVTQTLLFFPLSLFTVVQQFYQTEVNNEYVIRGNAAVLKCSIPSFVADFVNVVSWHDTEGHNYAMEQTNYGTVAGEKSRVLVVVLNCLVFYSSKKCKYHDLYLRF